MKLACLFFILWTAGLAAQTFQASSEERADLGAGRAFDGNDATRWSAKFSEKTGWIQITFDTPVTYDRVVLFSGILDLKGAPRDFDILAGDSEPLKLLRSIGDASADGIEHSFPATTARIFRIAIKKVINDRWSPTLSEVRFTRSGGNKPAEAADDKAGEGIKTTASDPGQAGKGVQLAFDGLLETTYESAVKGKEWWIERRYPDAVEWNAVRIRAFTESGYGVPRNLQIRARTGGTWQTLLEVKDSRVPELRLNFRATKAKEWRLVVSTTLGLNAPLRISELEWLKIDDGKFPELSPLVPAPQKEINAAIDRGVAWLRKNRRPDGNWSTSNTDEFPLGVLCFAGLALRKSGVGVDDPLHAELVEASGKMAMDRTYSVALAILYLRSLSKQKYNDRIKSYADYLIDKQAPDGLWGYPEGRSDLSNAQYALLGLRAAHEVGVKIPAKTIEKSWDWLIKGAQKDGGFNYVPHGDGARDPSTGSMTAAALASLRICEDLQPADRDRVSRSLPVAEDAFRWLDGTFTVAMNPNSDRSHYYWLYGLERVGSFFERREIAGRNWYQDGARHLVTWQNKNGSWHNSVEDTCFALLFLNRASLSTE